ncbi:hypothetical protein AB0G35_19095 [Streptomyces sp. NPDC021749]|uniref:hypothetical protein n=1 Tax=Streptomyces sp. NPDC021749 TaxID=3154905 RepID=UPI0033F3B597
MEDQRNVPQNGYGGLIASPLVKIGCWRIFLWGAPLTSTGHAQIVGKSTVTVGTTDQGRPRPTPDPAGESVEVAWNPEFPRKGHPVEDTLRPDRLLAGVTTPEGGKAIRAAYAGMIDAGPPTFVTAPRPPSWPRVPPTSSSA